MTDIVPDETPDVHLNQHPVAVPHPSLTVIERIEAELDKVQRVPIDFMAWLKAELAKAKAHL